MTENTKKKIFKAIEKKIGSGWLEAGKTYSIEDVEEAVKLYSEEIKPIKYRRTPMRIKVWI